MKTQCIMAMLLCAEASRRAADIGACGSPSLRTGKKQNQKNGGLIHGAKNNARNRGMPCHCRRRSVFAYKAQE